LKHGHELGVALCEIDGFIGLEAGAGDFFPTDVLERGGALFLAEDVHGTVPANGEEPGFEVIADCLGRLFAEFDKRFLDHIAGAVHVVQQGAGIGDEWCLELLDGMLDEGFAAGGWGRFFIGWH